MALRAVGAATRALASRRPCVPRVPVCAARGIHRTASACDGVHPLGQVCVFVCQLGALSFSLSLRLSVASVYCTGVLGAPLLLFTSQVLCDDRLSLPF